MAEHRGEGLPFQVGKFNFCLTFPKDVLTAQAAKKHLPSGPQDAHLGRLRVRHPFVLAAWKLLGSLSKLYIRVKQWTKHKWNTDYLESTSKVRAFIPGSGQDHLE